MRLSSLAHLPEEGVPLQPEYFERLMKEWTITLSSHVPELDSLFKSPAGIQHERGYFHTLHEICQQPFTWLETAAIATASRDRIQAFLKESRVFNGNGTMVLTGSGSSHYVGDCLTHALQPSLRIPVQSVPSGSLLTHTDQITPRDRPCVIVSFARSGDSPESRGVLELLLEKNPLCRHLIITCNRNGRLAIDYRGESRVLALVLDDKTCDRSLVMTSSFTNMTLAGRVLGMLRDPEAYQNLAVNLAQMGSDLLERHTGELARVASREFKSAVYLGSGGRYGSARESALKMLEMTAGQIMAFSETFLGLRHGPMSGVRPETLVVCFLSSDPSVRAYELDLIAELNRKRLGMQKVIVGDEVPREIAMPGDLVVECPGMGALGDENVPILHVLVGQILGFFSCRRMGLKPDSPSNEGVISRVVESFTIHKR
ncbi:MAG TPA: tagatose-6-phosphate ketose isomerase [Terriglobia bacterium]|nr:tagatose-6-phosphate ketose isomerase [Terriglobia bacterium]